MVWPLLCEATRAVPSPRTSTSPLRTSSTAFSMRPVHCGRAALAFSATSDTAAHHTWRVSVKVSSKLTVSVDSVTFVIALSFLATQRGRWSGAREVFAAPAGSVLLVVQGRPHHRDHRRFLTQSVVRERPRAPFPLPG